MNKFLRAYEHARFLLTFDSKADLSGRLNLLGYLTDSRYINIEVRQMANVRCLTTVLLGYKNLTI